MTPRATLVLLTLLGACAAPGTGGERVMLDWSVMAAPEPGLPLGMSESAGGRPWTIRLDEARVVVGAVYLFPPPMEAQRRSPQLRWHQRLAMERWLLGRAAAHAGDDNLAGFTAIAEYRENLILDALSTSTQYLSRTVGETGIVDSASVYFDEPRAQDGSVIPRHHQAWVSGVASRDGVTVAFEAGLEIENTPLRRRIDQLRVTRVGDAVEAPELVERSEVRLYVRASEWLRRVDFDRLLTETDDDGIVRPIAPSQFHNAWYLGLHNRQAFSVEVSGGP